MRLRSSRHQVLAELALKPPFKTEFATPHAHDRAALCLVSIAARARAKSNLPLLPPWVSGRRGDCIRWHLRQIAEALPPLPIRPGDPPSRSRPDRMDNRWEERRERKKWSK